MTAPTPGNARPNQVAGSSSGSGMSQWDRVAAMDEFRQLLLARIKFVVPATIFFCVYYFALPILVGYAPHLMDRPVLGPVNIAYLFALSQFFMAWIIAYLYVRAARRFDALSEQIHKKLESSSKAGA
jgi:uncharacterized membrane protein (DUF485 family)